MFDERLWTVHTSDDDEFVRKHQFDVVKVSCERIDDYAVTKVFLNPIYHLTVSVKEGYGQSPYWGNLVATRVGDALVPIRRPTRDGDFADYLLSMLRPDHKLTSEDVAETLQWAMDLVFPTMPDNKWTEKFRRSGNQQWQSMDVRAGQVLHRPALARRICSNDR